MLNVWGRILVLFFLNIIIPKMVRILMKHHVM